MKILLINLKSPKLSGQKQTFMPPVHLWKIRSTLIEKYLAQTISICDEQIGEKCEDYFEHGEYDIVGISCRFSIQHSEYLRVAKLAKSTGAYIIAGGQHASCIDIPGNVDVVTSERGEEWFYNSLRSDKIGICKYPFPEFTQNEIKKYWDMGRPHDLQSKTKKWMSIVSSVGCNRKCHFCINENIREPWKPYSYYYMDRQFEYLKSKGVKELFFEDDNISLDKNRFIRLIKIMNHYGFWWSCPNGIYIRSLLDDKIFKALVGSGCWRLSLPFETGSKRTAKLMGLGNKWLNFISAEYIVNRLNKIGIQTCGFFIIGYPGETELDIQKTFEYANRLNLKQRNIYIATPYPGTRLYEMCVKNGYINVDDNFYEKLLYKNAVINTPWLSAERVMELKAEDRRKALERRQNEYEKNVYGCQPAFK